MESDRRRGGVRAWLAAQQRMGARAARPVLTLNLVATLLAIGQAYCAALVLGAALSGASNSLAWSLGTFALFAQLRAAASYLSERASFSAGAAARRRLRTEALASLLKRRTCLATREALGGSRIGGG